MTTRWLIHGNSGVSALCQESRIHQTLPIDVSEPLESLSTSDWAVKIGALPIIDSAGIVVTREITDLEVSIGYIWSVTFLGQPGNINTMSCNVSSDRNNCMVRVTQHASLVRGSFSLQTAWPHEYEVEVPSIFETGSLRSNIHAEHLKMELESIRDNEGNQVFGEITVHRSPFIGLGHLRWSGGYTWTITFNSRDGNIPQMECDKSLLLGSGAIIEVADEDSGPGDTFQGVPNFYIFANGDSPSSARDGNQVSGSFTLSWAGNSFHTAVTTGAVFTAQQGGSGSDKYIKS